MHGNNSMSTTTGRLMVAVLLMSLVLGACNLPLTPVPQKTETPAPPQPTPAPTEAATQAPAGGSASNCPVGKWQVTDLSAYFTSLQSLIAQGTDMTLTGGSISGTAWFEFKDDGTLSLNATDFTQGFTAKTKVLNQTVEIPASLKINGSSQAKYTADGGQITVTGQQIGTLKISVDLMGSSTDVPNTLLGEQNTTTTYQYACPTADTLSLKVQTAGMDLAPLTLTRIK